MAIDHKEDLEFTTGIIKRVEGLSITTEDGMGFLLPADSEGIKAGLVPKPGDEVRFYGPGFGSPVRGVTLNGEVVFYRTEVEEEQRWAQQREKEREQQDQEFEASRASLDARYGALPLEFRRRIDRFRRNNPRFRQEQERYELFCCEQALALAERFQTVDEIKGFMEMELEQQKAAWPGLSEEHSGNTFGQMGLVARIWLEDRRWIPYFHGALCGLVGCDDYGCRPFSPEEQQELDWLHQEKVKEGKA